LVAQTHSWLNSLFAILHAWLFLILCLHTFIFRLKANFCENMIRFAKISFCYVIKHVSKWSMMNVWYNTLCFENVIVIYRMSLRNLGLLFCKSGWILFTTSIVYGSVNNNSYISKRCWKIDIYKWGLVYDYYYVRNPSVNLSTTLVRKEKVEHYIKIKDS